MLMRSAHASGSSKLPFPCHSDACVSLRAMSSLQSLEFGCLQKSNNKIKEIKNVFFLWLDFANKFKEHFKKEHIVKNVFTYFSKLFFINI